jgi:hypothetical protein
MSAVKDRLVNVPVAPTDIINTITNIPRTPREAGLIMLTSREDKSLKIIT